MRLSLLESELKRHIEDAMREADAREAALRSGPPPPPEVRDPRTAFSSAPPPSFTHSILPPPRWSSPPPVAATPSTPLPSRQPIARSGAVLLGLAALTLMGSIALLAVGASRAAFPRAAAAEPAHPVSSAGTASAMGVSCSEPAPAVEPTTWVVATPAPTLAPARRGFSAKRAAPSTKVAEAPPDSDSDSDSEPVTAPPAAAPAPSLDKASRTAQMLREQLDSSIR